MNLSRDEEAALAAIGKLNRAGRTTNNSQIARESGLPRTAVTDVVQTLRARHLIHDVGKGAAYHWRITRQG